MNKGGGAQLGTCPRTGLHYQNLPKMKQFNDNQSLLMKVVEKKSSKGKQQKRVLGLRFDYLILSELTNPPKVKRFVNVGQVKEVHFFDSPNKIRTTVLKFRPTIDKQTKQEQNEVDLQFCQSADPRNPSDGQTEFVDILKRIAEVRKIIISYHTATSLEELSRASALQKDRKGGYQSPNLILKERRKSLPPEQGGLPASPISKVFSSMRSRSQSSSPTGSRTGSLSPASPKTTNGSLPPQSPTSRTARGKSAPPSSGIEADPDFGATVGSVNGSFSSVPGSTRSRTVSIGVCNEAELPPVIAPPKALASFNEPTLRFIRVVEKKSAKGQFQKRVIALTHSKLILAELNCSIKRYLSFEYIEHIYYQPRSKVNGKRIYQYLVKIPSEGVDILFQLSHDDRNEQNEDQDEFQRVIRQIFTARSLNIPFELLPEQPDLVREARLQKPEGWVKPARKAAESPNSPAKQRTSSWFGGMSRRNSKPPESPKSVNTSLPRARQNAEHPDSIPAPVLGPVPTKQNGNTLTANKIPDQEPLVSEIYQGLQDDEQVLFRALANVNTNQQWSDVRRLFKQTHPGFHKGDPIEAMQAELRGRDYKKCVDILSGKGITIDGPLLKPEERAASACSGEPLTRLNSALKRQKSDKEEEVSPPVSPFVLRHSANKESVAFLIQEIPPITVPAALQSAFNDPNTDVLFIRVVERVSNTGHQAPRVLVVTPHHVIVATFMGSIKRYIPLESVQSAVITRSAVRQYLLCVPSEDSDLHFITSNDERNSDDSQTSLRDLLVKLFQLRSLPFSVLEVAVEELKEHKRLPAKRRASIAPAAMDGVCSTTGLPTTPCPAHLMEYDLPNLLYIRIVECRNGDEHKKAVLCINHSTLKLATEGDRVSIQVNSITAVITQVIDHSGVPVTLYLIRSEGAKDILIAQTYDERNASHNQDTLGELLKDLLAFYNKEFDERQLPPSEDITKHVDRVAGSAKTKVEPEQSAPVEQQRKGSVPPGLAIIASPPEFRQFNASNLLYARIVEKISAKGLKQKRVLMLTTSKLIVADEKAGVIKREIPAELITDMSLQLTTVKHFFSGKEETVYTILLRVPSEGLDLLFVQSHDARNASDDQEEFPKILRSLLAHLDKSLVERHVGPSENMSESAVLKRADGHKTPDKHRAKAVELKEAESAVDDMFANKAPAAQPAPTPVPASTQEPTQVSEENTTPTTPPPIPTPAPIPAPVPVPVPVAQLATPAPEPVAAPTTDSPSAHVPATPAPVVPVQEPSRVSTPVQESSAPETQKETVPIHQTVSIEAQELERLREEIRVLRSPERDMEHEQLKRQLQDEVVRSEELKTLVEYLHKENNSNNASPSKPVREIDPLEMERLQNEIRTLKKDKSDAENKLRLARNAAHQAALAEADAPISPTSLQQVLPSSMRPKKAPAVDTIVDYSKLTEEFILQLTQAGVEPHEMSVFNVLSIRQGTDLLDASIAELKEYLPGPLVRRVLRIAGYQPGKTDFHPCISINDVPVSSRKEEKARKIAQERLRIVQSENQSLKETILILKEQIKVLRGQRGIPPPAGVADYEMPSPTTFSSTSFSPSPSRPREEEHIVPVHHTPVPSPTPSKAKRDVSQDRTSIRAGSEGSKRSGKSGKSARSAERARLKAEAAAAQEELDRRLKEEELKKAAARQQEAIRMEQMAIKAKKAHEELEKKRREEKEAEADRQKARELELQQQKQREVEQQRLQEEHEEDARKLHEEQHRLQEQQRHADIEREKSTTPERLAATPLLPTLMSSTFDESDVPEPEPKPPAEPVKELLQEVVQEAVRENAEEHVHTPGDAVQQEMPKAPEEDIQAAMQQEMPKVPEPAPEETVQSELEKPEEPVVEEAVPTTAATEPVRELEQQEVVSEALPERKELEKVSDPEPELEPVPVEEETTMAAVVPEEPPVEMEEPAVPKEDVPEEPVHVAEVQNKAKTEVPPIKDMPTNVPSEIVKNLPEGVEVASSTSSESCTKYRRASMVSMSTVKSGKSAKSKNGETRQNGHSEKAEDTLMAMVLSEGVDSDFKIPSEGFEGLEHIKPNTTVESSSSEA
eukprot:TRINITY_DN10645_c0_g1_i1.p1 TRINITY_DN10645_c0_g1~~TRINITY_DN10645_c0_g1_i1.p1  ORF type:complete len:2067 (+),score=538.30 TRINITY_DN10645_c0_g1_i1:71-6271(+)